MVSDHVFNTNMDYYKVFYYVVKYKNITLAAERLSLTQPSVTKTIHRLEEDLRCKLFTRSKRGVALTTEGAALWARVESACELIIAAERELEAIQTLDSGTMNIASVEMGFTVYVLPALRRFLKDHPNVKVRFITETPGQILEMLKSGLADIAVLITPVEQVDAFDYHAIDAFHETLIVGPAYKSLAARARTLKELSKYPFISMPEGSSGKAYMRECFERYGLAYEPAIEVVSIGLVIQTTAADFGIGTVPPRIAERELEDGTLFRLRLKDELPERQVLAITNRAIAANRATKVFLDEYLGERPSDAIHQD